MVKSGVVAGRGGVGAAVGRGRVWVRGGWGSWVGASLVEGAGFEGEHNRR